MSREHNTNIAKPNRATIYSPRLSKIGINQVMDLIENQKQISINYINSKNFAILEKFELASVVKCLPKQWKENTYNQDIFNFLSFNCQLQRDIETKMTSKSVYKKIIKTITINLFQKQF